MKQIKCKANITATGKYLPEKVLTNHDMEKLVDTSDEWIQIRTGIRERRMVQNGQATVDMSTKAVRDLIEKINLNKIYNYYGLVEQAGSVFIESKKCGYFHTSVYSDIFIRDKKFNVLKNKFFICRIYI